MKIIYVHPVRTAGTTITEAFRARDPEGMRLSWDSVHRDWLIDELRELLDDDRATFIHNHAGNWSPTLAGEFRERGWRLMVSVRHVGDQLCSLWYRFPEIQALVPLDAFVREQLQFGNVPSWSNRQWAIPAWAMDADFVISDPDRDLFTLLGETPNQHHNSSSNPGWSAAVQSGLIHSRTVEMLADSIFQRRYRELKNRAVSG